MALTPSIRISGLGAVTPLGWGVDPLRQGLARPHHLTPALLERAHIHTASTPVLRVPPPPSDAPQPKHPRLRRVSPISKFAAAAALEALGPERLEASRQGSLRVGVITTLMNGCVNYSSRFFGEVLQDPSTASPILFPETVFNAPSSHLSALLQSTAPNDTLLGDSAEWFTGLELATEWLLRGDCDGVLVVSAEELDWLSAEALQLYSRHYLPAEGAAAVYLEISPAGFPLLAIPDPVPLASSRPEALRQLFRRISPPPGPLLLSDSRCGVPRFDRHEDLAYADWNGPTLSVRKLLGEALGASSALQTVAALLLLENRIAGAAWIATLGGHEQAAGTLIGALPS